MTLCKKHLQFVFFVFGFFHYHFLDVFLWFSFRPHIFLHHPSATWEKNSRMGSIRHTNQGHTGNLKDTSVLKHLDTTLDASVNSELHQRVRDNNKTINKWLVYVHHVLKHWQGQWLYDIVRNFLIAYVVYINSYIHGCNMYTYLHIYIYIHALLVFTHYIETCVLFCVLLPLSIRCSQYLQNRIQTNKMEHVVNVTFHSPCFFLL